VAHNGVDAVSMLRGAKPKFDLFVMDLVMPEKDGFAVLEDMKKDQDNTPVIVASNLSQKEDMERVKKLGAVDYFVKSNVSLSDIVQNINKIIGGNKQNGKE